MAAATAATAACSGTGVIGSFGRGRGRGRGLRANAVQQQPRQPGPSVPTQSTPQKSNSVPKPPIVDSPEATYCSEVMTIMNKLNGLSEDDVMKIVVPVIDGLDSQTVIEDLVRALSEKALNDPCFASTAAKISQKLWDNESIHTFVRNPLLGRTQGLYNQRKELQRENRYHGLCVYLSELFRILRIRQRPLRPMGLPVLELLKGLIEQSGTGGGPSMEDAKYFYQEMSGIGSILMGCLQPTDADAQKIKDKLEEVINCARNLVISSSLAPQIRCRLVHVIELHAGKWTDNEHLSTLYDNLLQDLDTTAPST